MFPVQGEANWLFNFTINDISVVHVTAHRGTGGLEKNGWTYGRAPNAIDKFVGFFNVPIQVPTRDQTFYTAIPTHRPN